MPMSQIAFHQTVLQFLEPIRDYLLDEDVSEILMNGYDEIYIEKRGRLLKTERKFSSSDSFMAAIRNVSQYVGRIIDETKPYMDARLPDGSRVHAMIPPCAVRGPYMAIRKFSKMLLKMDDLIAVGTIDRRITDFLNACVRMRKSIIVSGGTGSGKSTLLNVISNFIPNDERIIVIEEASELQLQQAHVLPMETRKADKKGLSEVTVRDLVACSLRLRPDRIIVGECRGGEALDMLQAMNTGHSGSMSTLHANSTKDSLNRLETMALMSDVVMPLTAIRGQIASAVDLIIQMSRFADGSRRITEIMEIEGLNNEGNYLIRSLFVYALQGKDEASGKIRGSLKPTGTKPSFFSELSFYDLQMVPELFSSV